jgi:hypothetical protein
MQAMASASMRHDRTGNAAIAAAAYWNRVGKIMALAAEQPHVGAVAPGHDPEAVVLDLVNPAFARWRLLGRPGQTRLKALHMAL